MPREIRAAVSAGAGAPPIIEPLILDEPAPGELVIEMRAAGICHTDIGVSAWAPEPRVYGHEGAGVVVDANGSSKFRNGDHVLATFGSCGECPNCQDTRPAYCFDNIKYNFEGHRAVDRPTLTRPDGTPVNGAFFQQSSFATHALVTERNIVPLPKGLSSAVAAPLGCGVQTGAGAVINNFQAKAGRGLLVIGCGTVGLSAIMAAKIQGCDPIIAVDLLDDRLELARRCGAHHTLRGDEADLVGRVLELTRVGVSYALDTASTQATFEASLASLHTGGLLGVLNTPGIYGEPVPHPGGEKMLTTTMVGILEGDSVPDTFIPWLAAQHLAGELPYDALIEEFPFEKIAEAFTALENGAAVKPVLIFAGGDA